MNKVNIKLQFERLEAEENSPKRLVARVLCYVTINGESLYAAGYDVPDMITYIDFFIDADGKGVGNLYRMSNDYEHHEAKENYYTLGALMKVCGVDIYEYLDSISEKLINSTDVNPDGFLLEAEFNG